MPRKMTGQRKAKSDLKKQSKRMETIEEAMKRNRLIKKKSAAVRASAKKAARTMNKQTMNKQK